MLRKWIWTIIALSQLVLGILFLLIPNVMLSSMGVVEWGEGLRYPLAMFSARLLVTSLLMLCFRRKLIGSIAAIDAMIAVQAIDLAAGIACGAVGVIAAGPAALPMVNAGMFILGLIWLRPNGKGALCHG